MATLTSSQMVSYRRSWWKVTLAYLGMLVLVSLILALGSFYWLIHKALPQLDGQVVSQGWRRV